MRAVTAPEPGGPEALTLVDRPDPEPGPGEVVLDVAATAVNRADTLQRQGLYPPPPGATDVLGLECSGTVSAVGEGVTGWAVGDEACALLAGGGYAEKVAVPAGQLMPLPGGVDLVTSASLPEVACTVWSNVFMTANLQAGEVLLVHGGGSGIGTVAIKQAKALGCTVIATAGSDEKCARMRDLGADHAVNYNTDRFESVCRRVTGKRGVDVVFEHVGAQTWAGSLLSLRMGGRLVTCGSTSGVSAETNLMMLFQRQLRIVGSFGASMRNVADGLAKMAGGLSPVLDAVLPLEGFEDALKRLESRRVFGKIVVTL